MILGSPSTPASAAQAEVFERVMAERGFDARRVWIAERDGRIMWATLPILSPGRTALLLSPQSGVAEVKDEAAALIEQVTSHLERDGTRLVQALVDPGDTEAAQIPRGCGFQLTAQLLYLQARISLRAPPPSDAWVAETYTADRHLHFAKAVLDSYDGSLDCPALNGVRDIEDIIAGHRAVGRFDPAWWFLLRSPEYPTPLGVLLLSPYATPDAAELVYMGLTPAARGRGLGDWALRLAAHRLATARVERLSLAVDTANAPALKLYYRHGFQCIGEKLAFMKMSPPLNA